MKPPGVRSGVMIRTQSFCPFEPREKRGENKQPKTHPRVAWHIDTDQSTGEREARRAPRITR